MFNLDDDEGDGEILQLTHRGRAIAETRDDYVPDEADWGVLYASTSKLLN